VAPKSGYAHVTYRPRGTHLPYTAWTPGKGSDRKPLGRFANAEHAALVVARYVAAKSGEEEAAQPQGRKRSRLMPSHESHSGASADE
jgi:hypothetical protein